MPLISSYPILSNIANDDLIPITDVSDINGSTGNPKLKNVTITTLINGVSSALNLFSGNYDDLTNKPILFSGNYNDLTNLPTLGTAASQDYGTSANQLVRLDANAKLPAVDGSNLTGINANLAGGIDRQVLVADNNEPTGYRWEDYNIPNTLLRLNSSALIDNEFLSLPFLADGDLLTYENNTIVRLEKSPVDGRVLTARNYGLVWEDPLQNFTDLLNLPVQDKGDLWTKDINGNDVAISLGSTNGQVLTVDNNEPTGLKWGSNIPYQVFSNKTANYTVTQSDHGVWIQCSTNNVTITLPSGLISGTQVIVDRLGTATVTFIAGAGTALVAKSTEIANQYGVVHCVYNGTNWRLTGDL